MALWGNIPSIDKLVLNYDTSSKPLPGKIVPCLVCGLPYLMRPYVGDPDQVCPDCFKVYYECAKLKCYKCQVVVARIQPGVTDSGYHIRKSAVLHLDKCNVCSPGLKESSVLEIAEWEQHVGRTKKLIIPMGANMKPKKE